MARPIWKGAISFGLVNVPVEVYPADQSHAISFSMLDKRDFAPIGFKRYNKKSGDEVPWGNVVKGYEYEKGQYVVLTDEDFRRANVKASQTIEIETFVPASSIPAPYFETPYYLVPGARGEKAYTLLRDALASENKIAVGQVVIRTKQHLVALIPEGPVLMMNVLRYANEIRDTEGLSLPPKAAKAAKAGVSAREMELAQRLIDDLSGPWKPEQFKDTYHEDLMNRIEEKIKRGETKELTEPEKEAGGRKKAEVIDLMELLKQSIDKGGKKPARAASERAAAVKKPASKARTTRHGGEKSTAKRKRA
ncbi:MAG: Ku protein [Betaproteobacteria bacterium]|nr:MAG: Ku protein [Betaproteobacteria bacterium]